MFRIQYVASSEKQCRVHLCVSGNSVPQDRRGKCSSISRNILDAGISESQMSDYCRKVGDYYTLQDRRVNGNFTPQDRGEVVLF